MKAAGGSHFALLRRTSKAQITYPRGRSQEGAMAGLRGPHRTGRLWSLVGRTTRGLA